MATLNTVEKIGRVLDLFTRERPEWGVSEVASELGVPRSSVHAMMASLVDIGLLRWRLGGRYRIGWRILELADVHRSSTDIRAVAQPVLERLVLEHGETCHLAAAEQRHVMYLDRYLGTHNITVQGAPIGSRLEPYCTGVGKALMAYLDVNEVADYLATVKWKRYTAATITDADELKRELAQIREAGLAFDLGEAVEDVRCVAAPVRDELGEVVVAISMSAPVPRFDKHREKYARAIKQAATEISRLLVDSREQALDHSRDFPHRIGPKNRSEINQ